MRSRTWLLAGVIVLSSHFTATSQTTRGEFKGEIVATLLPDGRNMKLVAPFAYVDSAGVTWDVPAGEQTDGASIPRVFWTTHPPFTGKYRAAAVIHDYYCRVQSRTWQATHNVFYEAMRAAGVDERTATVMWAAVYNFGPRWGPGVGRRGAIESATDEDQRDFMRRIDEWVERSHPTREEIARAVHAGKVPQ